MLNFGCVSAANFYPRPPRGGRRVLIEAVGDRVHISIHALREEGDARPDYQMRQTMEFLSTPSARRATLPSPGRCQQRTISIHALREEGDRPTWRASLRLSYFYPRPPRGGRPYSDDGYYYLQAISIHALREEGDTPLSKILPKLSIFLSTPSARRATKGAGQAPGGVSHFYPRPPRGGRPRSSPRW